jgi:hypothetical protein
MANELQLTEKEAYEIADSFAQASARVLDFRITNRSTLSEDEALDLEKCEDRLDHMVVLFRGYGIRLIAAGAQDAVTEPNSAIALGKDAIAKVNKIKKAIKLASALVDLAVAVLAKDPKGIVAAAKSVQMAAKGKDDTKVKQEG